MCLYTPTCWNLDHFMLWSTWAYEGLLCVRVCTHQPLDIRTISYSDQLELLMTAACMCLYTPTCQNLDHFLLWSTWAYEGLLCVRVCTHQPLDIWTISYSYQLELLMTAACVCLYTPTRRNLDHFMLWLTWAYEKLLYAYVYAYQPVRIWTISCYNQLEFTQTSHRNTITSSSKLQ